MSVDQFIDGLCAEADEAVRALLRQSYDRGFREGLASTGQQPAASTPDLVTVPQPATPLSVVAPIEPPAAAAPTAPAPVAWTAQPDAAAEALEEGEEAGDPEEEEEEGVLVRPILSLATVGTLRRRITRTFDLERFDIDVVICRAGDTERRQLKSSVRLSSYRKEEG